MNLKKKQIFLWSLYDFANQPFSTLIVTFIFSTFFTATFAKSDNGVLWASGITMSSILIASISPIIGALADASGKRKIFFSFFTIASVLSIALLYFPIPVRTNPFVPLIIFVISNVTFEIAFSLYNSYLPDISNERNVGKVSGNAWAFGFVGGLLALIIALLFITPGPKIDDQGRMEISLSELNKIIDNGTSIDAQYLPYFKKNQLFGYEIFGTINNNEKFYVDISPLVKIDSLFYYPKVITKKQLDSLIQNRIINFTTNVTTSSLIKMGLYDGYENSNSLTPIIRMDSLWNQYNQPLNIKDEMELSYYFFNNSKVSNDKDLIYKYINKNDNSNIYYGEFTNIRKTNIFVSLWFLLFSIPTLILIKGKRKKANKIPYMEVIIISFRKLFATFREIRKDYIEISKFLLARLFYNDGLITIFAFGGIYAQEAFDFTFQEVMYFGIFLSITAAIGSFLFGYVDDKIGGINTIQISNIGLIIATLVAVVIPNGVIMHSPEVTGKDVFWVSGFFIGLFSGPIQSASRSVMSRITPDTKKSEFFGFYAFSGKATAFFGPFLLATLNSIFDSPRPGVLVVAILILIGSILLKSVSKESLKV